MTLIRSATSDDREAIHEVHLRAFPDSENELVAALAVKLLTEPTEPATINLVAEADDGIIGHIAFSREDAARFAVPYALEFPHGWQAIVSSDGVARDRTVTLTFKSALQDPAYW